MADSSMTIIDPITARDFSSGRIAKATMSPALVPNNSVANSINIDYSEIIGSGIVRKGKLPITTITTTMTDGEAERVSNSGDELKVYAANLQAQTFTPQVGGNTTAIIVRLYFVGSIQGLAYPPNIVISLVTTSGGNPTVTLVNGNSWTFSAGTLATSYPGAILSLPTSPNTVLTVGTTYAIVIQFANGDGSDYVEWIRNASTTYANGISKSSSNSGGSWSNNTGAFYFAQQITANINTYNIAPLGNYSFLNLSVPKNVLAFSISDQGLNEGALYYYNTVVSAWRISNLFTLNSIAKVRFANMNGSVFMVNGVNLMKSSSDFGSTWTVTNCISPYPIDTAGQWDSGIDYAVYDPIALTGGLVQFGSFYYISIQGSNTNKQPDSNPSYWQLISWSPNTLTPSTGDILVFPSLILSSGGRLLASGFSSFPSRVYFSQLIQPASNPFFVWNTDSTNGDWIDIDPDFNGVVTAFAVSATLVLVFKNNAMYRLNTISKTVDPQNIFNVGAVSQEAVTTCLGIVYFYSGNGIYQTDGTFPKLISRIGVQDFVDAITDPLQVYSWQDGFNVYFSIGTVTITFNPEDKRTYQNVVLKFSTRDQNWQVFTYNQYVAQTTLFGVPGSSISLVATEYNGQIATLNVTPITGSVTTVSDDGNAIPYSLETQELEFGNRSHQKVISDRIVVYTRKGGEGMFLIKQNDGNFESADLQVNQRVNVGDQINFSAEFFTFRWQGEALGSRPVFEGYHIPKIQDLGIIQQ